MKVNQYLALQASVVELSQVALQDHSVDEVAIRAVAGAQILADAYQ
jgi:hypothetical protein